MADVKKTAGGRYSGKFANEPRYLPGKHAGDVVEFKEADISDWMFMRNDKIVGGETHAAAAEVAVQGRTPMRSARGWNRRRGAARAVSAPRAVRRADGPDRAILRHAPAFAQASMPQPDIRAAIKLSPRRG